MGRWALGFNVGEKSFSTAYYNKKILRYVLITSLVVFAFVFAFFYFKSEVQGLRELLIKVAAILSFDLLIFLSSIWVIYLALDAFNIKRSLSAMVAAMLLLWIICEMAFAIGINYLIPPHETLNRVIHSLWNAVTMYVPTIIIFDKFNPITAIIESAKAIVAIFIESISLGLFFLLLALIVGLPLILGLVLDNMFPNTKLIPDLLRAVGLSLAWGLALVRSIGETILYLHYKKEISTADIKK